MEELFNSFQVLPVAHGLVQPPPVQERKRRSRSKSPVRERVPSPLRDKRKKKKRKHKHRSSPPGSPQQEPPASPPRAEEEEPPAAQEEKQEGPPPEEQRDENKMDMPTPEEMARADIARDPSVAGIYANAQAAAASGLTSDEIDWKKLHEEDTQNAQEFAQDKGWDPDAFADPNFCAACAFKGEGAFHDLNVHAHRYYREVSMETLLMQLQTKYRDTQLLDMRDNVGCPVRWWYRKQIFLHMHKHNLTNAVRNEQHYRNMLGAEREVFRFRMSTDHLSGVTSINPKAYTTWTKLCKEVEFWAKQSDTAFQKNERAFF